MVPWLSKQGEESVETPLSYLYVTSSRLHFILYIMGPIMV